MNKSAYAFRKWARGILKQIPLLVIAKRRWISFLNTHFPKLMDVDNGSTKLNVVRTFRIFVPNSGGRYRDRSQLTIQTINQTFPALGILTRSVGIKPLEIVPVRSFPKTDEEMAAVRDLKGALDRRHSDKANLHDYHYLYGTILVNRFAVSGLFEIGLGTNNTDVVSTMGATGSPGASLRAFRDFLPNANVYGADIDKRILFSEDRIKTFFLDQTKPEAFQVLDQSVPSGLDLVIDDGLHSPDANILSLNFGLSKIKAGGWVVIEDIGEAALPVWQLMSSLLPSTYQCYIFRAEGGLMFAVKRPE